MIKTFDCHETRALFHGEHVPRFSAVATRAERKLQMLDAVHDFVDLATPFCFSPCPNWQNTDSCCLLLDRHHRLTFRYQHGDIHDVAITGGEGSPT